MSFTVESDGVRNSLLPLKACTVCKAPFLFMPQLSDLRAPVVAAMLLPVYLTFNNALRMTPDYIYKLHRKDHNMPSILDLLCHQQ